MNEKLRLLQVEDDEADAELVRRAIEKGGFDIDWARVDTEPSLDEALRQDWDIIISDFAMPEFSGLHAFDVFKRNGSDTPFLFVSGALGEERAVEAMRAGARDYFLKGNLARLGLAVRRELQEARNRRDRRAAEEQAAQERRRLNLAIEASNAGVFEVTGDAVEYAGPWSSILGFEAADLPAGVAAFREWFNDRIHVEDAAVWERIRAFHRGSGGGVGGGDDRYVTELRIRHKDDDRYVDLAVFARAVARGSDGAAREVVGVVLDVSSRRQLEAQLRQSQKMEAVGQLAGGVAHDFNNLLTAILSFATFAYESVPADGGTAADLDEVLKAARRAQTLTSQLLAFSRRKTVAPRVLNVNDVVEGIDRILRRLLGADIEIVGRRGSDLGNVKIDPEALEQVLLNLGVNARDAMPGGGQLTIETLNAVVDESDGAKLGMDAHQGEYVVIAMTDTGTGMDAATQSRIFEPFFTTKEPGRGTGLGLSTCYGIVKQADGFIAVASEIGRGTTFRLYLPRIADPAEKIDRFSAPGDLRGSENVLIVEDDDQVRKLAARTLSRHGYTVIEAVDGTEALRICEDRQVRIDLLLTDVVMPSMGGFQLVESARVVRPALRVLFMSGYAPAAMVSRGVLDPAANVLQKPFTPDVLASRVRQALGTESVSLESLPPG